ncbi:TRM11 family SAM-dependent methyltransferase [Nannocystaceae bacterium ST9]
MIESRGNPAYCVPLRTAFEAANETPELDPRESLTHGFHSFPARMHPAIARVLLRELQVGRASRVLDPFCGSGTVLVEAMIAGWRSLGSDLDPLALRLARVKTEHRDLRSRERFLDELERVAEASSRRVRERVDIRADLPASERQWYEVHTLKELAGLLAEIRAIRDGRDRRALEMVFSAIAVKFSQQRAETAERQTDKRIRKGLPTEFFLRKGVELADRWAALEEALPEHWHPPRLVLSDARVLPHTLAGEFRCDLVLSSPPYGGTYDYVHHHARRHAWLGIQSKTLHEREIGARRHLSPDRPIRGESPHARWDRELLAVLVSLRELMRPDATMVLLIGDADLGRERVPADTQLERLAVQAELEVVAVASQPRPDWRGGAPRREHLVALRARL